MLQQCRAVAVNGEIEAEEVTLIVEFISKIIIDHGRKEEEDQQQAVCIKPHKS